MFISGKKHIHLPLNFFRFLILISIILFPSLVSAGAVAVQSIDIKPYNDAFESFQRKCDCTVKRIIISEVNENTILKKVLREEPDLILAIGIDALNAVKRISDIPIVYIMVLSHSPMVPDQENITGINMAISPAKQLSAIKRSLPGIKSIGIIYDPLMTGNLVKEARAAAGTMGIELVAHEVHKRKDFSVELRKMKGSINAYWMLPDLTVVAPETSEFLILFSIENRIPVITFSDKYLEIGALISLNIDASDMGEQAWEMAKEIMSGKKPSDTRKINARKAIVMVNRTIAGKMGIKLNEESFDDKSR